MITTSGILASWPVLSNSLADRRFGLFVLVLASIALSAMAATQAYYEGLR